MRNNLSKRDIDIVNHIFRYCTEIDAAIAFFGNDEDNFKENPVFRNAVSMPIQQIGELSKHLSDDFVSTYSEIPWKQIKGMREWFAHQYLSMNHHIIWTTATSDLLPLKDFCRRLLYPDDKP